MRQIRTDLAMESARAQAGGELPGVNVSTWDEAGIRITEVSIDTDEGARLLEKPIGKYITLECAGLRERSLEAREASAALLGEELARLLPDGDGPVLVIGLGNRMVTPDAIGPKTVDSTLVTRHLYEACPAAVDERMSPVCAIAPGVLGITGVETQEVVRGVVDHVQPRAAIVVDALAAQSSARIGTTIQLTNGGIHPGSGVGNQRKALCHDTLGVPVVALGVPTVIYASSLVRDALCELTDECSEEAVSRLEGELRTGALGEMIVTPREVDGMVAEVAKVLANGINRALHPGLSEREIRTMMD